MRRWRRRGPGSRRAKGRPGRAGSAWNLLPCGLGALLAGLALLAAGCGSDFTAPPDETTGRPAAAAGQVLDLDVDLPHLVFPSRPERGAILDLRLDIDGVGEGRHAARITLGPARVGGERLPVENLGAAEVSVTVSGSDWTTSRIGPLSLDGMAFEVLLRGGQEPGGWLMGGKSWESQSGLEGTFRGWRRHRFLSAGTDFLSPGWVEEISLVRGVQLVREGRLATVSSDPVMRSSGEGVFVLNRLGFDNAQRLDPQDDFRTAWQRTTGQGSNPHDLVLSGGKGFVSRYEPPFNDLAVIDPGDGTLTASIPLEDLTGDPAQLPRPDRLAAAEGVVFAGLQNIDRSFSRYGEGLLAVVDPDAGQVAGVVPLPGKNPGRLSVGSEGGRTKIYVAMAGIFPGLLPQELSGGVAVVDAANRVFERWALDDDDAGGNVIDARVFSETLGYALVSDASYTNSLLAFEPAAARVLRVVYQTRDFVPEMALSGGGVLALPDRSFGAPGVCLWAVPRPGEGAERFLGCASTELPPASLTAVD